MTVQSTNNRNNYVGNDTTETYNYTFRVFLEDDLSVVVTNTTTEVDVALTKTTDYTVTGVTDDGGGTIVLVDAGQDWISASSFLDTGFSLSVRRVVELKQETDIRNQGDFYPEVHEDVFDKLTMTDQQQQDEIDRGIKLPESVDPATFDSNVPVEIAGTPDVTLITNSAGDGWAVGPTADQISSSQSYATAAAASASAASTSETNAATSETNAATSETNAAVSAAAAAASAALVENFGVDINSKSVSAGDTLTFIEEKYQLWKLQGDSAARTMANAPFGTDDTYFFDGQRVSIMCLHDTNTVTFEHQDIQYGCIMNGNLTMEKGSFIEFIYIASEERFIEIIRN